MDWYIIEVNGTFTYPCLEEDMVIMMQEIRQEFKETGNEIKSIKCKKYDYGKYDVWPYEEDSEDEDPEYLKKLIIEYSLEGATQNEA